MGRLVDFAHAAQQFHQPADIGLGRPCRRSDVAHARRTKTGRSAEERLDLQPEPFVLFRQPRLMSGDPRPGSVERENARSRKRLERRGENRFWQPWNERQPKLLDAHARKIGI